MNNNYYLSHTSVLITQAEKIKLLYFLYESFQSLEKFANLRASEHIYKAGKE